MAKQIGKIKITGTIDELVFYKMSGEYYVRMKSSLNGKRVKKDPAFRKTMKYAKLLGQASQLASKLYKALPVKERGIKVFRKITGEVMKELKKRRGEFDS